MDKSSDGKSPVVFTACASIVFPSSDTKAAIDEMKAVDPSDRVAMQIGRDFGGFFIQGVQQAMRDMWGVL